ncbi:MAG: porin [Alphaproteobacteria bacterium]
MKKILLGTTGLVGAALLATAASAETPKVTLGGFSDFQAGWVGGDEANGIEGTSGRSIAFRNDNEISVRVDGKTDAGLGYGAVIDLEADLSPDVDNEGTNASRTYTYLEGGWGRVELGGNKSVAATMRVDASTLAVGSGGINGAWHYFVNPDGTTAVPTAAAPFATGGAAAGFITSSKLQVEHGSVDVLGDESDYNDTKATYYTPRFYGLQAGVSYTPNTSDKGQIASRLNTVGYDNVWDVGLGYETQWSGVKIAASGTGEWAETNVVGAADIRGWNAGALLGWQGFSLAGSYGDWATGHLVVPGGAVLGGVAGTGGTAALSSDGNGSYWTAGLGYDAGPIGLSATWLDSKLGAGAATGQNKFHNLVLGADYKLAPGLTPYAEVSFYDFNYAAAGAASNSGDSVILGTQVAF